MNIDAAEELTGNQSMCEKFQGPAVQSLVCKMKLFVSGNIC